MSKREGAVTFLDGCVIEKDYVYLASKLDSLDVEDRYTRMWFFDDQVAEPTKKFFFHDLPDWRVVSVCVKAATPTSLRTMCALSENGDVAFSTVKGTIQERIPGGGLPSADAHGQGYVSKIKEIGKRLYVCGVAGQIYRRDDTAWESFDDGVLQDASHVDDAVKMITSGNIDALAVLFDDMVVLNDIDGLSEKDIYVVGDQGRIFHSKGKTWTRVESPIDETLVAVKCVSAKEVYICGYNGALLKGNWKDGFTDLSGIDDNDIFLSVEVFQGVVYIASGNGLYTFTGSKMERLTTGLVPEVKNGTRFDARDGRLWVIANKDLAYFDGIKWTRVVFLANAPLI